MQDRTVGQHTDGETFCLAFDDMIDQGCSVFDAVTHTMKRNLFHVLQ